MSRGYRRLVRLLGSASVLTLGAGASMAQTLETLEPVVVVDEAAKTSDSLDKDVIIDREDIARTQPTDLKQLFSAMPSVTVAGGSTASQKFYVHGIDESKLNVTIDGARQKNNVWHHNGNTGIDPIFLKSIAINEGVAPADYGPGALGGAVLFETVSARDMLDDGQTFGAYVSVGYDTNSETIKLTNAAYGMAHGFEMLAALTRSEGQDYSDGDGRQEPGTAADLWNGLGKVAYQSGEGHRFEVSGEYYRDDGYRRLRTNMGFVNAAMNDNLYERLTAVFTYTNENADGLFDPKVRIYYNKNALERPNKAGYARASGDFNSEVRSVGGLAQNTFHFGFGDITAGFDFYKDEIDVERFHFANDVSESISNVGAYVQARLTPFERFDVSTGLRADFQSYDAVDGQTFDNFGLSPNIDLGYEVVEGLTLRGGYAYVFGGIEQSEAALFHAANYVYASNLKPTWAHNAKLGLEYELGGLTLGAKLFYIKMLNPVGYNFTSTPRQRINGDDLVSQGFDLSARYDWTNAYVSAAFTHADVKYGNRIALAGDYNNGVPVGDMLNLGAGYTFTDYNVTIGANAEIAFEYSNADLARNGYVNPIPGYGVVDIFGEWKKKVDKTEFTLRAEVNNLFDETYYSRGTYNQTATVTPVNSPGRTFYLSASAKF
ncbi:TonB-dependent receptor plug domain-containing protein [Polymorphum gilvum]|uniref:TonB-dependent outer membrane receptor n=1 Tax=Polymorphum gilvum (strain LMG 25793 / CGMCC 1.9160 / SL003B-26A1) TaxID=991905 RepID=F2IYX2_POLGS|nr:TonB-dependent receptor [Polymorphum gilvum]ADZ70587.1 TonB-dependent outer membrane receptor [Polymorphum gilvum SL003B-26A1]